MHSSRELVLGRKSWNLAGLVELAKPSIMILKANFLNVRQRYAFAQLTQGFPVRYELAFCMNRKLFDYRPICWVAILKFLDFT